MEVIKVKDQMNSFIDQLGNIELELKAKDAEIESLQEIVEIYTKPFIDFYHKGTGINFFFQNFLNTYFSFKLRFFFQYLIILKVIYLFFEILNIKIKY